MKDADPKASDKSAILLIDDEQPLLDVFKAALSPRFEVTTANSVREADFYSSQEGV